MFIKVIEVVAVFGAVMFIIAQIVAPAILGRPIFGMFRKEATIKKEIESAFQEYDEAALKNARDAIKKQTTKIRSVK